MNLGSYINIAVKEAKKSNYRYRDGSIFRLGALLLRNRKIISKGHNKRKTHPQSDKLGSRYLHAEVDCLKSKFKGDTLIVIRILKNNNLTYSKPCKCCMNQIKKNKIKNLIYTDWFGNIIKEKVCYE